MKKIVLSLLLLLSVCCNLPAQNKAIQSFMSYTTYYVPGEKPFIENAMAFDCSTVVYRQFEPGKYKASVEIQTIFKQGDKVCNYSKVALDSPVVTDTTKITGSFIDQQRFSLENGEYTLEISVMDLNSANKTPFKSEQTVVINFPTEYPAVSDILLVDTYSKAKTASSFTKNGYDLIPRVYAYYLKNNNTLTFYAEAYNSDKYYKDGGQYLLNYYIESYESSIKMKEFNFTKRVDVGRVNVLLNSIDIRTLPTGNYYLVVEMRDRSNKLLASNSTFFQRYNPGCEINVEDLASVSVQNSFVNEITNIDTLREYIRCLNPRCSEIERDYANNLVLTNDVKTMQQFFHNFWATRAPLNPKAAWDEYYAQVKRVNASYSTRTKKGYMSDRGYVYLKYGTPDKICEEPYEPGAFPYEIWHYYEVANQRNKHFVFMSRDMVTNDYALIHSDVVGEVNNYRWQLEIYSRFYGPDYTGDIIDQTTVPDAWGTHAGELYNNPR
ncbi:MAG: GWxTD domain-containing protein [Bacteroidales bacterium]|nr:GWxTD domain-containing protein [Bacteroidales bacterium]